MFMEKLAGTTSQLPPMPKFQNIALAWLGGALAISLIAVLGDQLEITLVLGSFGASCVLVFGFPSVPFSQPRNIIIGHTLSSFIGLIFLMMFGPEWWSLALAVGTTIAAMMLTRTVHPPAGSNPVIVFLTQPSWDFLWLPTLAGAVLLVVVALLYNNISREESYPIYW